MFVERGGEVVDVYSTVFAGLVVEGGGGCGGFEVAAVDGGERWRWRSTVEEEDD